MSSACDNLCGLGKPGVWGAVERKAGFRNCLAETVRGAIQAGEYASSSGIVREAPRDWRHKRALQAQALGELRAKVQEGLADIEAGRLHDLDAEASSERERDSCGVALLVVGRPRAPDPSVTIVVDTNVFVGACLGAGASNEVSAQCLRGEAMPLMGAHGVAVPNTHATDTGSLSASDTPVTALTLNLPDEKLHRLEVVAQARGATVAELFEEMSTVMLTEADAETRFRLCAERGAGREARGLALLRKSVGDAVEGQGI